MTEDIKVAEYVVKIDRKYMASHEWVKEEADGTYTIGISDYAQKMLREISYVQFEEAGETYPQKSIFVVVEALKASGDIYAPFDLELIANNEKLEDEPELINSSPYEDGWLAKFKATDFNDSILISPQVYADQITAELEDF